MIIIEVVVLNEELVHVTSEDGSIDTTFAHDGPFREVLQGREGVRMYAHVIRTPDAVIVTPIDEVR